MVDTSFGRPLVIVAVLLSGFMAVGCGGGGGTGTVNPIGTVQVSRVDYGRLADIYGLRQTPQGEVVDLYQSDVLIGRDIRDERVPGQSSENRPDSEVRYDFVGSDPDTLQPRVLIPRPLGSEDFLRLFDALDDDTGEVAPLAFGQGGPGRPYSVVPRNGCIRVQFSGPLGVTDEFFVVRDIDGRVIGLRNTEAVQLLQIGGDPSQQGTLQPLPCRIIVGTTSLLLDPVLLGTEGLQYETQNNASGLPASPDSFGANIRLALALEGPLAIPGLRSDSLSGLNNGGRACIIRDFRSGNDGDTSPDLSRGFVLDPEPPRFIGELPMYLQRVDAVNPIVTEVLIWKGGIVHEIDRGDVIRFIVGSSVIPLGNAEVVADPADDLGQPEVQRVRVRIRNVPNLEDLDPTNRPDYPQDPAALDAWLRVHAPRAVLVCEYQGGRIDSNTQQVLVRADDPSYFGIFSPTPLPLADGVPSPPGENVSPFAGAVIRLSKPVDIATVKMADTFFFATRNLTDQAAIDDFIATRPWRILDSQPQQGPGVGMALSTFNESKFRTPHLIASRVIDEDGSQTTLRLQPLQGFYLDQAMRQDGPRPYYLHVVAGAAGIRDLAGNPVDLQTNDVTRSRGLVIPFTLDIRSTGGQPLFEDNHSVYVVRRYADVDEDENPSYYLPEEVQGSTTNVSNSRAQTLADVFGGIARIDGRIEGRPTTRLRKVADNFNQAPVDPQTSILRWCPQDAAGEPQIANNTATAPLGQGVQNPFNPYGCRLQTVWREIDLSLSRTDPFDFNLDIEQVFWAPFTGTPIEFDEFDKVSLQLGHSERRPEPCVGNFGALPTFPDSGLVLRFDDNYVRNLRANSTTTDIESRPSPHRAFDGPTSMRIEAQATILEPTGRNRYLPLPAFKRPHFVYRDETVMEQGCSVSLGADVINGLQSFGPWILSPWNNGIGRRAVQQIPTPTNGSEPSVVFNNGFWQSGNNYNLRVDTTVDRATDGLVGNLALPLLADFFVECDSAQLPAGNGYVAFGLTGWQISVALQSSHTPFFRVYSAGRPPFPNLAPICREPNASPIAQGGYSPPPPLGQGGTTFPGDNTFYWVMLDFLKRASVATSGFFDLYNPHRVPNGFGDSRLGPYFVHPVTGQVAVPAGFGPRFVYEVDPPATSQPAGTSVVAQFRAASAVDPDPWYWREWVATANAFAPYPTALSPQLKPDPSNFALDPYKATDAHIRKYDDRQVAGVARNWWTYFYNRTVTGYALDPNSVVDPVFLNRSSGPNEGFTPADVRYVNWRLLMSNNTDAVPPVSPTVDTFALAYRFQRIQ